MTFRTAVTALGLIAFPSLALAASDDELRQQILGAWGQDPVCAEGSLTFAADGTFAIVMADDDPESGTWSIADGVLTGTDQPTSSVAIDGDTLSLGDPEGGGRVETFNRCPD
jgi:hypothetical protein